MLTKILVSPFGGEKAIAFEDSAIALGERGRKKTKIPSFTTFSGLSNKSVKKNWNF